MASTTTSKLSMRLLIDTKTEKVIFAVASKRVVDFLFNMLCLPIEFHKEDDDYYYVEEGDDYYNEEGYGNEDGENGDDYYNEDGSDGVYYDDDYFDEDEGYGHGDGEDDAYYGEEDEDSEESDCYEEEEKEFQGEAWLYRCPNKCSKIVTTIKRPICYRCKKPMEHITDYSELKPKDIAEDNVTFLVTDDLVFQPVTSMIEIVNKYNIKDYREMIVELGINEGIKLLKASLETKMILTSVFVYKEY